MDATDANEGAKKDTKNPISVEVVSDPEEVIDKNQRFLISNIESKDNFYSQIKS